MDPVLGLPVECTESQGMAGVLGKGAWLGSFGGHLRTLRPFISPLPVDHSGLFLYSLLLYRKGNRGPRGKHCSCPSLGARFHRAAFEERTECQESQVRMDVEHPRGI